jgi:tight adherence protein C
MSWPFVPGSSDGLWVGSSGGLLVVALTLLGRGGPTLAVLPPLFAAAGVLGCDYRLTRAARQRIARVEEELPTVLEFLSLCLAAGEGLRDALRRVGEVGSGVLTGELRAAVLASGTGSSLPDALLSVSKNLDVPALARAIEHLWRRWTVERPRACSAGAGRRRARGRQAGLLELAGRKEILMLLPLVFLILPLSVLFAIFPGIVMLRLGVG